MTLTSITRRVYSTLTFVILSSSCLFCPLALLLQGFFFFLICQQHGIRLYDPVRECTESGHRYLSTGIKTQSSRLSVSKQFNIVSFHDLTIIQEHNYLSLLDFVRHLIAWFCSFCHLKPVLSAYSWELSQQLAYFREKKNLYSNISFCHHR